MTHVKLKVEHGVGELIVDGVDMSRKVLAEGLWIESSATAGGPTRVHMIVAADVFEADLPEAVLNALREPGDPK